jgi:hypothetical protein
MGADTIDLFDPDTLDHSLSHELKELKTYMTGYLLQSRAASQQYKWNLISKD